jgi:hypothetical protein
LSAWPPPQSLASNKTVNPQSVQNGQFLCRLAQDVSLLAQVFAVKLDQVEGAEQAAQRARSIAGAAQPG